jgi:CBS domain containing-hemolysin-like protein
MEDLGFEGVVVLDDILVWCVGAIVVEYDLL